MKSLKKKKLKELRRKGSCEILLLKSWAVRLICTNQIHTVTVWSIVVVWLMIALASGV